MKKEKKRTLRDKEDKEEEEEEIEDTTVNKKTKKNPVVFNMKRVRKLQKFDLKKKGTIMYWMSRDHRVEDNWALIYSQKLAIENDCALMICFYLINYPNAPLRHYDFMIKGLKEVEKRCNNYNIPLYIKIGKAQDLMQETVKQHEIVGVVADCSPLRISMEWKNQVSKVLQKLKVPFWEVDAHNVIPVWITSDKEEHAAKTIRKKVENNEKEYLTDFIDIKTHTLNKEKLEMVEWKEIDEFLEKNCDKSVGPIDWLEPGYDSSIKTLNTFLEKRLDKYGEKRNDPTLEYCSNLSPFLHFGQISAQRVLLEASKYSKKKGHASFKEEIFVRRELAENFCYYNKNYDNFEGFKDWAKTTLNDHSSDKREHLYSDDQLEFGKTYDPLWNAAQFQLIYYGKIHSYMRMYWAKKILEWTTDPKKALSFTNFLNDKYSVDGRDPNGYVGSAWSIGGIHDQGWKERDVFGKIRFMNFDGCKRKFDVQKYINLMNKLKKK